MEEQELPLIPKQDEIRVFANGNATITIQQDCWPDSPVLVMIAPEFVEKLIVALKSARDEITGDAP